MLESRAVLAAITGAPAADRAQLEPFAAHTSRVVRAEAQRTLVLLSKI